MILIFLGKAESTYERPVSVRFSRETEAAGGSLYTKRFILRRQAVQLWAPVSLKYAGQVSRLEAQQEFCVVKGAFLL